MSDQYACSTVPSSIPDAAEELRDFAARLDPDLRGYECVLDGEVVGYRVRTADGRLVMEQGRRAGRMHGYWRDWDDTGRLTFETHYVDGREHGLARQWYEGRLVGGYRMEHGTGVDLWRDADANLSEERHYRDGHLHGYERWWSPDGKTIREEGHYDRDQEHGIFRSWNAKGRLRRSYPRYFVHGRRVNRAQYLRTRASDPSLPPFIPENNAPARSLPAEYLEQDPSPEPQPDHELG